MYITDEDLEKFVGDGSGFERLIHDLIRAEAWVCNIPQHQIDWDYRTNVGDGGKDVLIRVGNDFSNRKFIPETKSIWSMKSGKDGLSPTTLKNEIIEHKKIVGHLKDGGHYIWCIIAPADNDETRDKLRKRANNLAKKYKFNSKQIIILHRDTITTWLKSHIGLIPIHLGIHGSWKTLNEWKRLDGYFSIPWIDFGNRSDLVETITKHLLGTGQPNVLHLVGDSGIGKTRTVLEACLKKPNFNKVLYYTSYDKFINDEEYLTRNKEIQAVIVIDDVKINQWGKLIDRMNNFSNRIRIVTIGPKPRGAFHSRERILEVPPPKIDEGVIDVIKSSDQQLSDRYAKELANWCDHDLRLALILVDANKKDPGLREHPISSLDDVWNRLLNLYEFEIGNKEKFKKFYIILSVFVDIGNMDDYREELEYLANYFEKPLKDFDDVINRAINCNLGKQQGRFFEASPLALARWIFEKRGWALLKYDAPKFINGMPTERMKKRFIERGQESGTEIREAINSALAEWFQKQFPSYDLKLISNSQTSRTFMEYTEMDPARGLSWLKKTIKKATPKELYNFKGYENYFGGWGGRRQIVWLCQHLACFPDYFWDCEIILYRLAKYETEKAIGNNSKAIWSGLFLPMLSWTSISFDKRLKLFIQRLTEASIEEIPLIIDAFFGMIKEVSGRMTPPKVVGGRLVPNEWRPNTLQELNQIRKNVVNQTLNTVMTLSEDKISFVKREVMKNISLFLDLDCLDILKKFLNVDRINGNDQRLLRVKLDEYINRLNLLLEKDNKENIEKKLNEIKVWRREIAPENLLEKIKDITIRSYFSYYYSNEDEEEVKEIYVNEAKNLLDNQNILNELFCWFDDHETQSSKYFGQIVGELDKDQVILEHIVKQIKQGKTIDFIAGYLSAVETGLPNKISDLLDSLVKENPKYIFIISIYSDFSKNGFNRIINCLLSNKNLNYNILLEFIRGPWLGNLTNSQSIVLLKTINQIAQNNEVLACNLEFKLLIGWENIELDFTDEFLNVLEKTFELCLKNRKNCDSWGWAEVVKMLPDKHIEFKTDLAANALVDKKDTNFQMQKEATNILKNLAARHSEKVMEAVGRKMIDPEISKLFSIYTFDGLFESIEFDVVKDWVENIGGVEGARLIARHVASPESKEEDPTYVPPLTKWLLTNFENDERLFKEFCAGRHSFEVNWSKIGGDKKKLKQLKEKIAPYLSHDLRRVREWAKYEIRSAKRKYEWDKKHDAELGRK